MLVAAFLWRNHGLYAAKKLGLGVAWQRQMAVPTVLASTYLQAATFTACTHVSHAPTDACKQQQQLQLAPGRCKTPRNVMQCSGLYEL
jgi:hypothetical protein